MINNLNSKAEYNHLVSTLSETQEDLSLVCFLGAGTSISQGYEGWNQYVKDLLNYWKSHLNELIDENSAYDHVNVRDLNFLDWLNNKSGYDNKRKVDITHLLIKNYCRLKNNNEAEWNKKYLQHENDFENYYFLKVDPLSENNDIIEQIFSLSGLFITSNYDDQIEKAYRRFFQSEPKVLDDARSLTGQRLPNRSIIHLHGKPDRPGVLLVSSSKSYSELYLNSNGIKERLKKQLKSQGSKVLLFIGSSLQEDEILNLFYFPDYHLEKFALMKYETGLSSYQADLIKQYYKEEKGITVLWYGSEFSELPLFLKQINLEVEQKLDEDNSFVTDIKIKADLKGQKYEVFDKDITKAIKNNEEFVDSCFDSNLNVKSISVLMHNKAFKDSIQNGTRYFYFWREVSRNFESIKESKDTLSQLLLCIDNMPTMDAYYVIFDFLYKYSQTLDSEEDRFEFLYKNGKKYLNTFVFPQELSNNDERVIWLLVNLAHRQNYDDWSAGLQDSYWKHPKVFKLSKFSLTELLKIMEQDNYAAIASFKTTLEIEGWKFIYDLILQNKLIFAQYEQFPEYVYKNKLMQRFLINLALEDKFPKCFNINLLKQNIKFNDKLMGIETNKFVEKFIPEQSKKVGAKYYINGWYIDGSSMKEIEDKPFFEVLPLSSSSDVRSLIEKLENIVSHKNPKCSKVKIGSTEAEDININGQGQSLEKALNNNKTWKNLSKYNVEFLKEAIKRPEIYRSFKQEINRILIKGLKLNYVGTDLIMLFFSVFSEKPSNILEYANYELLEYLSASSVSYQQMLFNFLFNNIHLTGSSFHAPGFKDNRVWISLDEFVNSKAYEFVKLVDILIRKNRELFYKDYNSILLSEIKNLSTKPRQYLKGWFFYLFKNDSELEKPISFIGFCHHGFRFSVHRFRLSVQWADRFKEAVACLLDENFSDQFCINNIVFVLGITLSPQDVRIKNPIQSLSFKNNIIEFMVIRYFASSIFNEQLILSWVEWGIKNLSGFAQILVDLICRHMDQYSKCKKIIAFLNKYTNLIKVYSLKIHIIYFNKNKSYGREAFNIYINLVSNLFRHHLLNVNQILTISIEGVLSSMSQRNYKDLISSLLNVSSDFLPSDDQKRLRNKYQY